MAGRETKLTDKTKKIICDAIRDQLPYKTACMLAGIHESTFYLWKQLAEQGKQPYLEFLDDIKKAEAEGEKKLLKTITDDPSWQSKSWILERRHPDRWSKIDKIAPVTPDGNKPYEGDSTIREIRRRLEALAQEQSGGDKSAE